MTKKNRLRKIWQRNSDFFDQQGKLFCEGKSIRECPTAKEVKHCLKRPVKKLEYIKPEIIEIELELEPAFLNGSTNSSGNYNDRVAIDDYDFAEGDYD